MLVLNSTFGPAKLSVDAVTRRAANSFFMGWMLKVGNPKYAKDIEATENQH
jgi:hypothetical protein